GLGEEAEPRALRPAHAAAVAQQLAGMLAVVVDGDGERAPDDLVEVQRDDAEQGARHREEAAAAEARVLRAADDATLEQVFPVRLELPEVGHEPAAEAPLLRSRGAHRDDRLAAAQVGAARERHHREALALDAHELAAASKPTVAPQHRPVFALRFSTSDRNTRGWPSTSK